MEMWYTRNDELHNNKESDIKKKVHAALDEVINIIYRDKPPTRILQADTLYFRRKQKNVHT